MGLTIVTSDKIVLGFKYIFSMNTLNKICWNKQMPLIMANSKDGLGHKVKYLDS